MEIFKSWLKEQYPGYRFDREDENIFSFSTGWENVATAYLSGQDDKIVRVDIRLAFRDVTIENLVDFIDYQLLFKGNIKQVESYHIIYLGRFCKEIPDNKVNKRFFIDNRFHNVSHSYFSFEKDPVLTEIIRNNYLKDIDGLQPISIKEASLEIPAEKKFGLRMTGIEKINLPERPLISIVIPSFNSESIIEQALQSAIVQTYDNKEIIVVDGGSKDSTASVVKKYEDNIDWFNSEPDKNIFDAINKGTYISNGMYSIFIGSDDLLMPDALENFVKSYSENGKVDFMYGDFINLHPSGQLRFIKTFIKSKYYGKFLIGHPAMFINNMTFKDLHGFNDEYYICADADFELKLITNNKKGGKLDNSICIFRGGGHSSFKKENAKQVYKIFKHYKALNISYYIFAAKMQLFNIFIKIFGRNLFAKVVSAKSR